MNDLYIPHIGIKHKQNEHTPTHGTYGTVLFGGKIRLMTILDVIKRLKKKLKKQILLLTCARERERERERKRKRKRERERERDKKER